MSGMVSLKLFTDVSKLLDRKVPGKVARDVELNAIASRLGEIERLYQQLPDMPRKPKKVKDL